MFSLPSLLRSLLADGQVRLVDVDRDRYGRTVAEVFTPSGQFVNAELVRAGLAWHYPRYSGSCPNRVAVIRAEAEARADKLGVFRAGNLPPWEWRKQARR
jgi:micrococcal nuclease